MGCQITYKQDGTVDRVLANNGNESILYKNALKSNTEESALTIWSVAQTDLFKEEVQPKDLDTNLEPNLKTVLAYITSKNVTEPLIAQETFDVKQSLIGTEYNDAHELATKLKEALLIPTKQTLKSLNLYNNSEINDILKDPVLKNNILETAQKILNTNTEITQSIEINKDYLRVNPNERNALGKYKMNNPNVLEAEVIQEFGGIKDENEFEQKLAESDFKAPLKPDNSQNKATTKLVAKYLKAKLGQAANILSESEMLAELNKRGFNSLQAMIIGEKGIQNINNSAAVFNLSVAKSMREKSYPKDTIRVATGWQYSERENKWKTEVEDGTFKSIIPTPNTKNVNFENEVHYGILTDIYSNDELFKAYPELRETNIIVYETDGRLDNNEMFFYEKNNTIYINGKTNKFDFSESKNTSKSVLLYEIQHAIQGFEGFARGGSSEGISKKIRETLTEIRASYSRGVVGTTTRDSFSEYLQKAIIDKFGKEKADVMLQSDIVSSSAIEEVFSEEFYIKLAGEVEARNVQSRMGQPRNQNLFTETEKIPQEQKIYFGQNNVQFFAKPLGTEGKVYGFYDQLSKEIFLNESLMSSNSLIHEAYHAFKPSVKIAAQKGDKTAKILLNEMNRIVDESKLFNEQKVKEDYKKGVSNTVYTPRQEESENDYVDRMWEEVEANLLAGNSTEYFYKIAKENNLTEKEKKLFIDKVKDFIKSFSDWIAKQVGFEGLTPEQASKLTTKDVLDKVTTTILKGQYKNSLFEDLSQFNKIKVVDENMQPKKNNAVSQTIRATLADDENGVVRATLSDLEGLSPNVWNSNANAVKTLLRNTQDKAVEIGLDLKGLEQSYDTKTQPQILELIRSLDFVLNNSSEQSLNNFVEVYGEFFDVDKSEQIVIEKVDEKFRKMPLVKLETKDSDYKVFKNFGLINIGDNIYLKTDALKKTLSEVDALMEANKMTLDESEMQDKVFAEDVIGADYDVETLKKLINYRKYFGAENVKKETAEVRVPQQIENAEYLKSDFIGDIRKLQLENPDNKVLQNLQFGDKGITLENIDPISIQEMNQYLEENQDLKNYFLLNRNTNFEIAQDDIIVSERDLIVNGKELPEFKDNFRKINSKTVQVQTNEDFIKIGKDNFERITNDLFSKLPTNESNFYVTNTEQPKLNINPQDYTSQKSSSKIEIKNKYSQKESEQIDNDIDCSK